MPTTLPKVRAFEIVFSDGSKMFVHEPAGRKGLEVFLQAMPAMSQLAQVFSGMGDDGLVKPFVKLPEGLIDALYPLLQAMTDLSDEEFEQLSATNQLAILQGMSVLTVPNESTAQPTTP